MSYYYVSHPNMDFSATVKAPSTDKARTAFLDYLERSGRMFRKDRQFVRRLTMTERIEFPEEVDADVNLNYDYTGQTNGEETLQVGYGDNYEGEEPEEEDSLSNEPEDFIDEIDTPIEQVDKEFDIKDTPIGRMSLGST